MAILEPHTVESSSVLEENEILIYAATWMNLENIMLGELTQVQMKSGGLRQYRL